MSEGHEEITVKVKYDPNKDDTIEVKINPNATVSKLEEKVQDALKNFDNISVGILKFNGKELDNKDKTLAELDIKDGSSVENENRVVLIRFFGEKTYITCNENTTVREFLEKLKGKKPNLDYINLLFEGRSLRRSKLNQKLLSYQIGARNIKYGDTLNLTTTLEMNKDSDLVFDLNNLAESKNSNYPPFRIIVGIADLLLLAAAVATFLLFFLTSLSISIAIPIVLATLFVVGAILFFGGNNLLPKSCIGKINLGTSFFAKNERETENERENEYEPSERTDINQKNKEFE